MIEDDAKTNPDNDMPPNPEEILTFEKTLVQAIKSLENTILEGYQRLTLRADKSDRRHDRTEERLGLGPIDG